MTRVFGRSQEGLQSENDLLDSFFSRLQLFKADKNLFELRIRRVERYAVDVSMNIGLHTISRGVG